ncbi:PH domain-containing protein [Microbacteriaceae bacterium 4G12]
MNDFQRVPRTAMTVWRQKSILWHTFYWLIYGTVTFYANHFHIPIWPLFGIGALLLFWTIMRIGPLPYMRWVFHGYEIKEDDLWLYDGGWAHETTIVPLFRIQHVQIQDDPLLRRKKLANIELQTAATQHHIYGLETHKAEELRDLLLLRLKEEHHV